MRKKAAACRLLVRQGAHLQQPSPPSCTHDADARSEDSHRVRCTGRENIGQHAVRKEEACGYLLRRTDGDMRRGLGWQRETSVQHLWASVDAPRTILIAACFFKAHFGLTCQAFVTPAQAAKAAVWLREQASKLLENRPRDTKPASGANRGHRWYRSMAGVAAACRRTLRRTEMQCTRRQTPRSARLAHMTWRRCRENDSDEQR